MISFLFFLEKKIGNDIMMGLFALLGVDSIRNSILFSKEN